MENKKKNIFGPDYLREEERNQPDYPVVDISRLEVTAYCKWLKTICKEGYTYRLPTEEEWEKAARGLSGRKYPWGNDFDKKNCNSKESDFNKTTPVKKYPQGISPYGCFDMAGNAPELTVSWYDEKQKVKRGGSWYNTQIIVNCFSRNPYGGSGFAGFRLVRTKKP